MALATSTATVLRDAHAESASICGMSVQYDMAPIGAEVSPELRAFAGLWQGAMDMSASLQWCLGLAVYALEPGRFHSRFIWSANAGRGSNNRANHGNIVRIFAFSNGVARFKSPEVQFELQMTSPNEVSGYRTDAVGRVPVWFKRK